MVVLPECLCVDLQMVMNLVQSLCYNHLHKQQSSGFNHPNIKLLLLVIVLYCVAAAALRNEPHPVSVGLWRDGSIWREVEVLKKWKDPGIIE